jgi:hypothetical protein
MSSAYLYAGVLILFNVDFIVSQYVLGSILLIFSIVANHYIYEFGSVEYNEKTFISFMIVSLMAIGNYNLNKSIAL